ncbi:interferon-induced protein with tetratricopeptide repeats 9 [Lepisosteus oculatus]|uniref:Interferon-induced protein with tetratricopeptide repeats 9 n=1 Tax=Lepisosteus oculatus TaxID=7918 RepID=W5MFW9_LEPOC|nr:PREDICTED: interferon-induced protein with tetratricopeptide repeats 5-like [Lepisosteus oculatus]
MSAPQNQELEVTLKTLECHFTWGIEKGDVKDLDNIPEKLLDRIKFCHRRYHPTFFNVLAFISQTTGKSETGLEFLNKAERVLREEKSFSEADLLVTYANFAWIYYHIGKLTEVSTYFGKLENICKGIPQSSKYSANVPRVYGEKGWTFLKLGSRFYQSSKESFQKALHGDPENVSFNMGYAVVLYRLEGMMGKRVNPETSDAVRQLKKVLQLEPCDSEAMVLLALKLQHVKKEDSWKLIKQALRLTPDVPQITRYVAKYFRAEGCIDQSLAILKKAIELAPHSSFLHHQIGLCYKQQLALMFQAQKGAKRIPVTEKRAKAVECIQYFKRAVELKPSNIHANINLAEAYGENRQIEDAEKVYVSLLEDQSLCNSDRQHCHTSYGLFLMYKKKSEPGAINQFKAAYQFRMQTSDRRQAGKKLKQIAERQLKCKEKVSEAFEILAFLCTEDKEEKKAMEYTARARHFAAGSADQLSAEFSERMKLK